MIEPVLDLRLIDDLLLKLNDGDIAQIFNYTELKDLPTYRATLSRVAPPYLAYFDDCYEYLHSLSPVEIANFYSLGMFHTDSNQQEFTVRDKLNFLGKRFWKQERSLDAYIEDYINTHSMAIIEFCTKKHLNYELNPLKEAAEADFWNQKLSSFTSSLEHKKNEFSIVDNQLA